MCVCVGLFHLRAKSGHGMVYLRICLVSGIIDRSHQNVHAASSSRAWS